MRLLPPLHEYHTAGLAGYLRSYTMRGRNPSPDPIITAKSRGQGPTGLTTLEDIYSYLSETPGALLHKPTTSHSF